MKRRYKNATLVISFQRSLVLAGSLIVTVVASINPQGYYPLELGNLWEYVETGSTFWVRAVRDTLMSNGETYTILETDGTSREFLRQSGPLVFSYNIYFQREELLYDFSKTSGDTLIFAPSETETTIVTVEFDGFQSIFGALRRQWWFLHRELPTSFYSIHEVTDSIGRTMVQSEAGFFFQLVGCIINGAQYGTVSASDENSYPVFPSYALFQNYPNPFNPSTTIRYELPRRAYVVLKVYDLLGEGVITLVDEEKEAGSYQVDWDATGRASGLYFYRLHAGEFV